MGQTKDKVSPVITPVWASLRKIVGCSESRIGRVEGSRNRRKMTVGSPHLGDCVKQKQKKTKKSRGQYLEKERGIRERNRRKRKIVRVIAQ